MMDKVFKVAKNKWFQYTVIIVFILSIMVGGTVRIIQNDKIEKEQIQLEIEKQEQKEESEEETNVD